MLTRRIGKILRGRATPFQVIAAAVLGSMIAFIPAGFLQAPGLILALLLILLMLNANLAVAAIIGGLAKLASLALMPVSFHIGRVLLDGPTQPIFKAAINAPVLAFFGFETYAVTGGLVLGLIFGLAAGLLIVAGVGRFRRKMASLEEGSERYKKMTSKWWVRLMTFVFVGGNKGKRTYTKLMSRKIGNPVRPAGVVVAVLVLGMLFMLRGVLAEPVVTTALVRGLERANGATVDLERASLDLRRGRLEVHGLAMADPEDLDIDLFRAAKLEADIGTADLLRKRLSIDSLVASDASQGERRETPGVLTRPKPEPREPEKPDDDYKTLEDYIEQAREWRDRLRRIEGWVEDVAFPEPKEEPDPEDADRETLRERLERRVAEVGHARVRAVHLVDEAPAFLIRDIRVEGLRSAHFGDERLDVRAESISTHPWLVDAPPRITVRSREGTLDTLLSLDSASMAGGESRLKFIWKNLPADPLARQLRLPDGPPLEGGTIDLALDGRVGLAGGLRLDMPLDITVRDSTVRIPGGRSHQVSELIFPVALHGPLSAPALRVDAEKLASALAEAGLSEAADRLQEEAERQIRDRLGNGIGDRIEDEAGGVLDRFRRNR